MTNDGADRSQLTSKHTDVEPDDVANHRPAAMVTYDFEVLSQGNHCLLIRLADEVYTLRKTHSGKLILNK